MPFSLGRTLLLEQDVPLRDDSENLAPRTAHGQARDALFDEDSGDLADLGFRPDRQHVAGHDLFNSHRVLLSDGFIVFRVARESIGSGADSRCGELRSTDPFASKRRGR